MLQLNRRRLLAGAGGFFAYAMRTPLGSLLAKAPRGGGRASRVLVLWMQGGPSHLETFDPKPHGGGQAEAISSSAAGLQISEFLPQLSQRMHQLSVIRNLTSDEGEHQRAQQYMHTGYKPVSSFPRPSLGSIVSHESPETALPNYVALGAPGFGPAFLGPSHAPFAVEQPGRAVELLRTMQRRSGRLEFIQQLNRAFDQRQQSGDLARRSAMLRRIGGLANTGFARALDIEQEPATRREKYGQGFGSRCLVARRLLETGVRFVEVVQDGWDTHVDNQRGVRQLCQQIDRPWSLLMDDLESCGLLEETVVLWMGEFGRTPAVNARNGRDHYPQVTPAVIGGGGLAAGQAIGGSNANGAAGGGPTHSIADLMATILQQLGVDPAKEYITDFGSPAPATDAGVPIAALAS